MIRRLWRRYMADIDEYERSARANGDQLMLVLVQQFKFNRIWAAAMVGVMLVLSGALIWKHLR
jgi:ABC-type Fe3+-siderophore transport system permease subunit